MRLNLRPNLLPQRRERRKSRRQLERESHQRAVEAAADAKMLHTVWMWQQRMRGAFKGIRPFRHARAADPLRASNRIADGQYARMEARRLLAERGPKGRRAGDDPR